MAESYKKMRSRTLAKTTNQNSTTFSPTFGKKLASRTFTPEPANEARDVSNPEFGYNFGDVQVESPAFKQSSPLSLSGPSHCTFGGACHTCAPTIPTKLKIGQPNDKYEQEADRVAEQVMRMPDPRYQGSEPVSGKAQTARIQRKSATCDEDEEAQIQRKPLISKITPMVQRQTEEEEEPIPEEEEEERIVQTKQDSGQSARGIPELTTNVQSLHGGGKPLFESTRAYFEPRFGHNFSNVRIHNDALSSKTAKSINAKAYTVGSDIVFGAGQYDPERSDGRKLLAHELTHVIQQRRMPSVSVINKRVDTVESAEKINSNKVDNIQSFNQTSKPTIQTKLKIGQPNDKYEQEADRVAEQVMRMPESQVQRKGCVSCNDSDEEEQIQAKPFYPQITPLVQRQTEDDEEREEEEEPIQAKPLSGWITPLVQRQESELEEGEEEEPVQTKLLVQRQAEEEEEKEFIQTKLLVNQTAPIIQRQRQVQEKQTIQTKCLSSQINHIVQKQSKEETILTKRILTSLDMRVSRQPEELEEKEEEPVKFERSLREEPTASLSIQNQINNTKGGGGPLPETTRLFMESRFGADFSNVRIHTDSNAMRINRTLNAKAFTVRNHIYFGAGRYNPHSLSGKKLIAHELVHTIHQSPNPLAKKSENHTNRKNHIQILGAINDKIQGKEVHTTFGPENIARPTGQKIHEEVLPWLGKANKSKDLFTEVSIPGGTKKGANSEQAGTADLYLAKRTIAIRFVRGEPEYLKKANKSKKGGEDFDHKGEGAPAGRTTGVKECSGEIKICRLNKAPRIIGIGDLKPGGTAEVELGKDQLSNYETGINTTKEKVNKFIDDNPTLVDSKKKWNPELSRITSLRIPKELKYPGGKYLEDQLALWGEKTKGPVTNLKGAMFVYHVKDGIWAYEWMPVKIPKKHPKTDVNRILVRLKEVIAKLRKKPDHSPRQSDSRRNIVQASSVNIKHSLPKRIQRQAQSGTKSKFNQENWLEKSFNPWKAAANKFLGEEKASKQAEIASVLLQLEKRSGLKFAIPAPIRKLGKAFRQIRHWVKYGDKYGTLRHIFGKLFVKISEFYDKIKEKFDELKERFTQPRPGAFKGPAGIMTPVIKVVFAAAAQYFQIITKKVAANLSQGLKAGATEVIKDLFSETTIGEFVEKGKEIENKVKEITNIKVQAEAEFKVKLEKLIKPFEEELKFANQVRDALKTIGNIINIVKWGARVVQCVTPPAVGCLKLILQELGEKALGVVAELVTKTCWFQSVVTLPLLKTFSFFKTLPTTITDFTVGFMKKLVPLPDKYKELLFSKFKKVPPSGAIPEELPSCDKKITKETHKLNTLLDKHGPHKLKLMYKNLKDRGIRDDAKFDMPAIEKLDKALSHQPKAVGVHRPSFNDFVKTLKIPISTTSTKKTKTTEKGEAAKPKKRLKVVDVTKETTAPIEANAYHGFAKKPGCNVILPQNITGLMLGETLMVKIGCEVNNVLYRVPVRVKFFSIGYYGTSTHTIPQKRGKIRDLGFVLLDTVATNKWDFYFYEGYQWYQDIEGLGPGIEMVEKRVGGKLFIEIVSQ